MCMDSCLKYGLKGRIFFQSCFSNFTVITVRIILIKIALIDAVDTCLRFAVALTSFPIPCNLYASTFTTIPFPIVHL